VKGRKTMPDIQQRATRMEPAVFPELAGDGLGFGAVMDAGVQPRSHQILHRAELEAQALVESARQRAAVLAQEGYRDGRLQGRAEAFAEVQSGLQQLLAALEAAGKRLRDLEEDFRARSEETVISLAVEVAGRILRAEVAKDPGATLRSVRAALAVLGERGGEPGEIVVRVHPDQCELLRGRPWPPVNGLPAGTALRFTPDPNMEAGGCLVETPTYLVDATLASQLDEARRRLCEEPQ
jgi:flagellar assembly protein FliH